MDHRPAVPPPPSLLTPASPVPTPWFPGAGVPITEEGLLTLSKIVTVVSAASALASDAVEWSRRDLDSKKGEVGELSLYKTLH